MKKILLVLAMLCVSVWADFKSISADELIKLQAKGIPVIDIRTPAEWSNTGIIKDAHKMMFFAPNGQADVASWFFELGHLIQDKNQPFIIYCAHANRTKTLAKGLQQLGFSNFYELDGGIENGWIKFHKPTIK